MGAPSGSDVGRVTTRLGLFPAPSAGQGGPGSRTRGPGICRAPPRPRGAGSRCRCACGAGAGRGRAAGVTLSHGAGGAAPRAAPGGPRPAAPQRCRGVLQASPGHVLVLRQGGAGAADPRRDPQGHRQHEGAGQELPDRPPGADHRQGSTEERFGGHRGADVVLHW